MSDFLCVPFSRNVWTSFLSSAASPASFASPRDKNLHSFISLFALSFLSSYYCDCWLRLIVAIVMHNELTRNAENVSFAFLAEVYFSCVFFFVKRRNRKLFISFEQGSERICNEQDINFNDAVCISSFPNVRLFLLTEQFQTFSISLRFR